MKTALQQYVEWTMTDEYKKIADDCDIDSFNDKLKWFFSIEKHNISFAFDCGYGLESSDSVNGEMYYNEKFKQ